MNIRFVPISGWVGDNMLEKSENMKWFMKHVEESIKNLSPLESA